MLYTAVRALFERGVLKYCGSPNTLFFYKRRWIFCGLKNRLKIRASISCIASDVFRRVG